LVISARIRNIEQKNSAFLTKQVGSFIIKKDFLHRWIYDRLTFALAISTAIQKNLMDTCPLPENKVLLLHNGVDINRFNPDNVNSKRFEENLELRKKKY